MPTESPNTVEKPLLTEPAEILATPSVTEVKKTSALKRLFAIAANDDQNEKLAWHQNKVLIASLIMVATLALSLSSLIPALDAIAASPWSWLLLATFMQAFAGLPLYFRLVNKYKKNASRLNWALASLVTYVAAIALPFDPAQKHALTITSNFLICIATGLIYFEFKALAASENHTKLLDRLRPKIAHKKNGAAFIDVAPETLVLNDVVKVLPGEIIPKDGVIVSGTTSIDESVFTGEFKPLLKGIGEAAIGATLNRDCEIQVQITIDPKDNVLDQLIASAHEVHDHPMIFSQRMEKLGATISYAGILAALITGYLRYAFLSAPLYAVIRSSVAVLVAFSAFSLSMALLISINQFLAKMLKRGVLFKKSDSIEALARMNTLFLDKTGTLTRGDFEYSETFIEMGTNQGTFLSTLFSLEAQSNHSLAHAMETHPWYHEIPKHTVREFKIHPGLGICGTIQPKGGREYFAAVGNLRFLKRMQMQISRDMKNKMDDLEIMGDTVLLCGYQQQIKGLVSCSDVLRPHVRETLKEILKLGKEPIIITGDSEEAVTHLARHLGIAKVYPRCTPTEKADKIGKEMNDGKITGFVGDIEDVLAFQKCNVSISLETGTDIRNQIAGVLLMGGDFKEIAALIKSCQGLIKKNENFQWATIAMTFTLAAISVVGWIPVEVIAAVLFFFNLLLIRITDRQLNGTQSGTQSQLPQNTKSTDLISAA